MIKIIEKKKIKVLLILVGFLLGISLTYLWAFSLKDIQNFFEKKSLVIPEDQTTTQGEISNPKNQQKSDFESYTDLENRIVKISDSSNKSVVSVIITKDLPVLEQYYYNPFGDSSGNDPFFKQFFGDNFGNLQVPGYKQNGTQKQEVGAGTGFIISSNGLILTNKHVVEDDKADYTVLANDGQKYPAKVLAKHPVLDLALLKIDKTGLTPLNLGNSDSVKVGQFVIAIGNSLGEFSNTVSFGVVSGLSRNITASGTLTGAEELDGLIQTDAAINRGNSGGPLINTKGEVIAINTAMAQGAQNVGFAIPINKAKKMIDQIEKTGKISYPFLGIRYLAINKTVADKNNLSVDYGALISRGQTSADLAVIPGSPADKAGIQENDIILEVNGVKVDKSNSLNKILSDYSPADVINLKILRKGKEINLSVTLEEKK